MKKEQQYIHVRRHEREMRAVLTKKAYRIKANKPLFDRWAHLKYELLTLAGIVQNDIEVDEALIQQWLDRVNSFEDKVERLVEYTLAYLRHGFE